MQEFEEKKLLNNEALLELLELLSGILLTSFLILHTFFISTIILGKECFDFISSFLEDFMLSYFVFLFLPFLILFHIILALRKVSFEIKRQISFFNHILALKHRDTFLWFLQVISGFFLIFLISIHIWNQFSELPILSYKIASRILQIKWLVFDLLLIFFSGTHCGLGVYRIGIKWGWMKNRTKSLYIIMVFIFLYFVVEIINLFSFIKV